MPRVEGADISIQDFLEESISFSRSHLQQGFENISILLIGVTSFIGSMILEKLLRSCPEIDNIYVLVRSKDGKKPSERMNDLFTSPLFDRLKIENPSATNKIRIIPCDLYRNDLGISTDDYLTLITEVHAVIHTARLIGTNVRFKEAVSINLKALQNILKLWQKMKKLDAVAYVSSLFAHSDKQIVEEKIYPCSINGYCLINMSENLPENVLDAITSDIKGDYPDISLFTLAMAENILNEKGEGLPLCIIRPSFVLASCNEPISGWIQKQRQESPTDVLLNVLLGKLFTIHYNGRNQAEAVPVDIVANLVIAATSQLLLKRKEWVNQAVITYPHEKKSAYTQCDLQNIQIYNIFSYNKQKVTWSEYFNKNIKHEQEVPFLDTVGYPTLKINTYWLVHWIMTWLGISQVLLHNIERGITGIKSEFLENVKILQNNSNTVLSLCKNFRLIKDDNVIHLWESMSISDRSYFDFDLKSLNWNQFFYTQCRGLRVYIMKDPLVTVPDAQIKRQRWKSLQCMFISFITISLCCAIYLFRKYKLI